MKNGKPWATKFTTQHPPFTFWSLFRLRCATGRGFSGQSHSAPLWACDVSRHLRARKCLNCNSLRVGVELRCQTISFDALASHLLRGVLGVLALNGRSVPGTLAGWARKVAKNSAENVPRNPCSLATEHRDRHEELLRVARGRPLAPACADAWRSRSNASHNANDTDVANSLAHALKNHP